VPKRGDQSGKVAVWYRLPERRGLKGTGSAKTAFLHPENEGGGVTKVHQKRKKRKFGNERKKARPPYEGKGKKTERESAGTGGSRKKQSFVLVASSGKKRKISYCERTFRRDKNTSGREGETAKETGP